MHDTVRCRDCMIALNTNVSLSLGVVNAVSNASQIAHVNVEEAQRRVSDGVCLCATSRVN